MTLPSSPSQAGLTIPAGFYRVSELADALRSQGVPVAISPECAQDTFVIRFKGVTWNDVREALSSGGRLAVASQSHGWIISRAPFAAERERTVLRNYLRAAGRGIEATYAPILAEVLAQEPMTLEGRAARMKTLRSRGASDPAEDRRADVVQAHFEGEGKPTLVDLRLTSALVRLPDGPPFGRMARTDLFSLRRKLAPDGSWDILAPFRQMSGLEPGAVESLARRGTFLAKFAFDPITLQANLRWTVRLTSGRDVVEISGGPTSVETPFPRIRIRAEDVWSQTDLDSQAARARSTRDLVLPGGSLAFRPGSLRISDALLRLAKATDTSLLCSVPAYTDDVLNLAGPQTLASVIESAEGGGIDGAWYEARLTRRVWTDWRDQRAWTESLQGYGAALRPVRFRNVSRAGAIVVVRDERQFLDQLCPTPTALPSDLENGLLEGRAPALSSFARHVASLKPAAWPTSTFATSYLRFCNPTSFYPFAAALVASPSLRAKVAELSPDGTLAIPFGRLDASCRTALIAGVNDAFPKDDTLGYLMALDSPFLKGDELRRSPEKFTFRIRRNGKSLEFGILVKNDVAFWSARVEGVASGA